MSSVRSVGSRRAVLALDVDGVLLDPTRGGRGGWQDELRVRFGIEPAALGTAFFERYWPEIVVGQLPIEPALTAALREIGSDAHTDEVLSCWFDADFQVNQDVVEEAARWADEGVRVILATNQEHRRARYLEDHLGKLLRLDAILYSADLGFVKSDQRFFQAAGKRLGSETATPVVLLDDDRRNLDQARRSGWLGVHFDRQGRWDEDLRSALLA